MATIRFSCGSVTSTVTEIQSTQSGTLLEIARRHGVPLLFNCEAGACGACLVRIRPLPGSDAVEPPGELEQVMLRAMQIESNEGNTPRFACQYKVANEACISVTYDTSIGGD